MILSDFHTHTTFCDGKDTPEEMVLAAIQKGMDTIGFSMHSFVEFDLDVYSDPSALYEYKKEIERLKEKYKDKIKILCGIEQDIYKGPLDEKFDYLIGSVHYAKIGEEYIQLDLKKETLIDAVNRGFGGDFYAFAEWYYDMEAKVLEATGADIIGHLDLIRKFNENGDLFDEKHPRYVAAYTKAVKALVKYNKPFEINTGAISRGYRSTPYPCEDILRCIYENGGKVLLSSDSHRKETLCFEFEKWAELARDIGFDL